MGQSRSKVSTASVIPTNNMVKADNNSKKSKRDLYTPSADLKNSDETDSSKIIHFPDKTCDDNNIVVHGYTNANDDTNIYVPPVPLLSSQRQVSFKNLTVETTADLEHLSTGKSSKSDNRNGSMKLSVSNKGSGSRKGSSRISMKSIKSKLEDLNIIPTFSSKTKEEFIHDGMTLQGLKDFIQI